MVKTHTIETVREYNEFGVLISETITETNETDDTPREKYITVSSYMLHLTESKTSTTANQDMDEHKLRRAIEKAAGRRYA